MEKSQFEIDFLADKANYYLSGNPELRMTELKEIPWEKRIREIALYRIDEISFEDKAPRKEALENVLSAMRIEGVNFIYLILGNEEGVHFYYGVARDFLATSDVDMELSIHDIGQYILEPGIKGNFRGSRAREVEPEEKRQIIETIDGMKYYSMLEGVPGYTKEDERFQGVDRLVDVMLGDTFGFMIIASSLNYDTIKEIENVYHPKWLIIEATGLAYPDAIWDTIHTEFQIDAKIITLLDASRWMRLQKAMPQFADAQLTRADVIIINKTDLVTDKQLLQIRDSLQRPITCAHILERSMLKITDTGFWENMFKILEASYV